MRRCDQLSQRFQRLPLALLHVIHRHRAALEIALGVELDLCRDPVV